ncbi:MAG: type VI secretion system protein ImpK [Salinisphaeraceae bacterium]|jgi:type VI secretion system protein ImpK|nr:type VI secretion system protein ImpK [Salinisphaeraceae bacterium]
MNAARLERAGREMLRQPSLTDCLCEGFRLVVRLRESWQVEDAMSLRPVVRVILDQFEADAGRAGADAEDIRLARYAYCALLDETVLASGLPGRDEWALQPLQLEWFDDQLAGEHFFEQLDRLRRQGAERLDVLEVMHVCLLLGFQGRYRLGDVRGWQDECARLGEDIGSLRGHPRGFAPHAAPPDRVANALRSRTPIWAIASIAALMALGTYKFLETRLTAQTRQVVALETPVIQTPAEHAHLRITLP